jgi:peroxiredoxin (alkyl hydroperoxide reductase subunit C)
MITIGQAFPDVAVREYFEVEKDGCSIGPNLVQTKTALAGRSIVIVGVPGAFTPTCSEVHVPGFLAAIDSFKAKGINEIWCVSVNDAFVMHAWGKALGVGDRVRMIADGSALLTKALGLELDLTGGGLGVRSCRYSMWVDQGVIKALNVDASGKLEKSDAQTLLSQIK